MPHNLFRAHERQLIRKGAFPGNLGWVVTENAYVSKTDRGILTTLRVSPRVYLHTWTDRDDVRLNPSDRWWDYRTDSGYQKAIRDFARP